ncbi:TEKT3 protein, partial [Polyodon spathula]|nr:TEKT3 protein [Polyodon spathula]
MEYLGSTSSAAYFHTAPQRSRHPINETTMRDSYRSYRPPQHHSLVYSHKVPWGGCVESGGDLPMLNTARSFSHHTPEDWFRSNRAHYQQSDACRRNAEKLWVDTSQMIQSKEQLTRRAQAETDQRLGVRIDDIAHWSSELNFELEQMSKESELLQHLKRRLCRALQEIEGPLQMAQECLFHRQKRMGIDLVKDLVEKELVEEVIGIKSSREQIRRFIDTSAKQLEANRSAQHGLQRDLSDKQMAYQIDARCHRLRSATAGINYFPGVDRMDLSISLPESWAKCSDNNILRSQREHSVSARLRGEAERAMELASRHMWSQYNTVNVAFANRIHEIASAKSKLKTHLDQTVQQIFQTERTISQIKRALREKEGPLKLAQTRMEERTRRPNFELCRDPPHLKLVEEIHSLQDTVRTLRLGLTEARRTLQDLVNTKSLLESDLSRKAHSLFIDQELCMGLRRIYPSTPRLLGYT